MNIFILYFTVIAFIPCSDGACSHDTQTSPATCQVEYEIDQPTTTHHDHEDNCCPPFCYCTCCGTSVTFPKEIKTIEEVPPVLISLSANNFYYTFITGNLFHANIWQPPRFC